ncbi:polysaccharide deacetylase family protein [Candidatus Micrarchaeota archaeon]|nr:polysaccharide deacetylase family protein [Candidatus Micrarchaeota archaeon]
MSPRLEITLPSKGRPKTDSVVLPRIGHREIDEVSELAHGFFRLHDPAVEAVPATAVNDFLKDAFPGKKVQVKGEVSPQLFLLVVSRHLYVSRLREAYDVAQRHGLDFLTDAYQALYREKMRHTFDAISQETGTEIRRQEVPLNRFSSSKPLSRAKAFFKRHVDTLRQIAGMPPTSKRQWGPAPEGFPVPETPASMRDVYLTFDDGPGPWTQHIVGMLSSLETKSKRKLPVTFFVTGNNLDALPDGEDVVRQAHENGHGIGSHSQTHDYGLRGFPSRDVLEREVTLPQQRLQRLLRTAVRHFRFPGGIFSWPALLHVRNRGMDHVDWSLDTGDYHLAAQSLLSPGEQDRSQLLEAARKELLQRVSSARPGDVILMHDSDVLLPDKILDMPVSWQSETAKQDTSVGRRLRARARGMFVASTLDDVIEALHSKDLRLAPLPEPGNSHRFSSRYLKRFNAKLLQAIPGMESARQAAARARGGARNLLRKAGDLFFGWRRKKND